ncbi:pyridoxamine 5'-phosphate oxidase family protein [Salinigranum halophilum]|uniref:pyridoxamine 5'-phosphate oxidase family protein n=1 Tax=Salinigranum halophilum TaxID=2565931 RepID=UPI00115E1832|nr:pyridoxamine 5'-phosphate oxidase family protein [Salinigranum halophilum]
MDSTRSVQMNDDERMEFLGTGGTGVVSFATDEGEPPYSLPVSYGYDAEDDGFYLRLAFDTDSEKDGVVSENRPVSLVVYDQTDAGWQSVVAAGRLEEVTEAAIDSDVVQAMRRIHIPLVDVFERHPRELTFRFFRLVTTEVSGRKEATSV